MRLFLSALVLCCFCFAVPSYAGFVTARHTLTITPATGDPATDTVKRMKSRAETFEDGYPYTNRHRRDKGNSNAAGGQGTGGWAGIAALIAICVGDWPLGLIFGAIGMKKGRKNRGLAKGAFIASIVVGALEIIAIAAVIIVLSSTY